MKFEQWVIPLLPSNSTGQSSSHSVTVNLDFRHSYIWHLKIHGMLEFINLARHALGFCHFEPIALQPHFSGTLLLLNSPEVLKHFDFCWKKLMFAFSPHIDTNRAQNLRIEALCLIHARFSIHICLVERHRSSKVCLWFTKYLTFMLCLSRTVKDQRTWDSWVRAENYCSWYNKQHMLHVCSLAS